MHTATLSRHSSHIPRPWFFAYRPRRSAATTGHFLDPPRPVYGNFIVDPKCDSVRYAMEIRVSTIYWAS